jgi:hypothetical protein
VWGKQSRAIHWDASLDVGFIHNQVKFCLKGFVWALFRERVFRTCPNIHEIKPVIKAIKDKFHPWSSD